MIKEFPTTTSLPRTPARKQSASTGGLSRLLAAAVVNKTFRELLLTRPDAALQQGYLGEDFKLSREDQRRVLNIHARDLADLALQLASPEPCSPPAPCGYWVPAAQPAVILDAK